MDLKEFLYAHFPHRWLDRRAEGTKRLFDGLFLCLKYVSGVIDVLVRNSHTRSAIERLPALEDEYGLDVNPSLDLKVRRGRIIAQKRAQDWPVTKEQLLEIFRALSVDAYIQNFHNEYRLEFYITENTLGIPYGEIYGLLDCNIRAHVDIAVVVKVSLLSEQYYGGTLTLVPRFNFYGGQPAAIDFGSAQYPASVFALSTSVNFTEEVAGSMNITVRSEAATVFSLNPRMGGFRFFSLSDEHYRRQLPR